MDLGASMSLQQAVLELELEVSSRLLLPASVCVSERFKEKHSTVLRWSPSQRERESLSCVREKKRREVMYHVDVRQHSLNLAK